MKTPNFRLRQSPHRIHRVTAVGCVRILLVFSGTFLTCLLALRPAHAATKNWGGSSSGNWATGANWSGGTVPANGDDLVFPSGAARLVTTNNFSPNRNFASVTLLASGYVLRGNPIVASNLVACGQTSGAATIDAALGMVFKPVIMVSNAAATLRLRGTNVSLLGTLTVRGDGVTEIASPIAGSGGLVKSGTNVLLLHGNEANTYAGTTTVNEGILRLSKTNVTAIPGNLTIGDGSGGAEADAVQILRSEQIADNVAIQINSSGLLRCGTGVLESIGPLTLAGGRTDTQGATATLILLNNVTAQASSSTARMDGRVSFASSRTFTVGDGSAHPDIVLAGNIIDGAGNVSLTKNGPGTLRVSGYSGLTGNTIIREGVLEAASSDPVGNTIVSNNAVLRFIGLNPPYPVIGFTLTLNGSGDGNGALQLTNGHSGWRGPVVLATHSTIGVFGATNSFTIGAANGQISGPAGFAKVGDGILRITNGLPSVFEGYVFVNAGRLELSNAPGAVAIPGNLIVGDGSGGSDADVVQVQRADQIADTAAVTVNASGHLDFGPLEFGENETMGPLTLNNGARVTGPFSSQLRIAGNITCTGNTSSEIDGSGELVLTGPTPTVQVTGDDEGVNLDISMVLSTMSLTKTGSGSLRIGPSMVQPTLNINEGRLMAAAGSPLAGVGSAITVASGATLQLPGGTINGRSLVLNGAGIGGTEGALRATGLNSNFFWGGSVDLASDSMIYVTAGGFPPQSATLTLTGAVAGVGRLIKEGSGWLVFAGGTANTYSGGTWVRDGYFDLAKPSGVTAIPGNVVIGDGQGGKSPDLHLNAAHQIANGFDVTMTNGMFDPNTYAEAIGTLNGGGAVTLGPGSVLTVSPGSGVTCEFNGSFSSPGSIVKAGNGTLILGGTSTHTGNTTVNAGTLQVDGSLLKSLLTVNGGARLQGNGVVGNVAPDSGSCLVTPGTSPGILTCSNFNASGTGSGMLLIEMAGTTPGTGHDQLDVRGTVNLNGIVLAGALTFASSLSNQFVIIKNDGADAVVGTFTGWPQNSVLTFNGEQFRISYIGGDGNDVVLTQISGVFRPVLAIERIPPASVRLLWATNNATGFGLQSNTNLNTSNWTAVSPPPSIVGANNVVTNTASGQRFYRLFKP